VVLVGEAAFIGLSQRTNQEGIRQLSRILREMGLDGFETIDIECVGATMSNIICLGDGEVIVGATNEGAIRRLEEEGLKLHVLDISEFSKGDAGPNCLIMPLERG